MRLNILGLLFFLLLLEPVEGLGLVQTICCAQFGEKSCP